MTKKKSSKVIKVTMATLATTVAVGGNSIVSLQAINNDNSDTAILDENSVTSPIIISEIVADSHQSDLTTTSGSDAFEYFELYNTSNQSINLDDYQVLYNNGSTISEWDLPANTILPANEALIVWIQNEESKDLDLALFREYYNLSADEGQIVKTENIVSGFSNSGQRELRVTVKNTKQILSSVIYNDEDVKAQTKKGINFIYNSGRIQESTYSYDLDPTPGSLIEQQKLESKYQFVTVSDGIVTINTAQEINAGEALVVKATTNLPGVILKATLKVNDKEYDMTYDNDGNYVYSVPASEISNEELLNITATFNDGINEITSATQTVTVNKGAVEFASPLLISELSPNSANVSGSDAYEYLQIFNVSDQSVAVNNYQLVYVNGDKEIHGAEDNVYNSCPVRSSSQSSLLMTFINNNEEEIGFRYEVEYFGVLGQAEMTLAPKESKTELIVISTARDTVDKAFHQLKILSGGDNGYDISIYGKRVI